MAENNFDIAVIITKIKEIIAHNIDRDVVLKLISELLKEEVSYYNWVGFYIMDEKKNGLELGPYSGAHTDHTFIPLGIGVCGQVAQSMNAMIVQDVSKIDNYLSCSINVKSEIVIPVIKEKKFVAELDIDSHLLAPFSQKDIEFLETVCRELESIF
jgi:L-methionine (R)-S-oxide reductase